MIAIHRFLLVIARPIVLGPINGTKSLLEIIRVTKYEAAIMAMVDGFLVGTMGVIKPTWWYGDGEFLTDRWNFVHPHFRNGPVGDALEQEALSIADAAGLPFINQGKIRKRAEGSYLMMPRVHLPPEN